MVTSHSHWSLLLTAEAVVTPLHGDPREAPHGAWAHPLGLLPPSIRLHNMFLWFSDSKDCLAHSYVPATCLNLLWRDYVFALGERWKTKGRWRVYWQFFWQFWPVSFRDDEIQKNAYGCDLSVQLESQSTDLLYMKLTDEGAVPTRERRSQESTCILKPRAFLVHGIAGVGEGVPKELKGNTIFSFAWEIRVEHSKRSIKNTHSDARNLAISCRVQFAAKVKHFCVKVCLRFPADFRTCHTLFSDWSIHRGNRETALPSHLNAWLLLLQTSSCLFTILCELRKIGL